MGAELRLSSQELGLYAADGLDVAATNLTIRARPAAHSFASRSVRRALLTPRVNPGSRYRCGKSD